MQSVTHPRMPPTASLPNTTMPPIQFVDRRFTVSAQRVEIVPHGFPNPLTDDARIIWAMMMRGSGLPADSARPSLNRA